jgi:hypothetical protein
VEAGLLLAQVLQGLLVCKGTGTGLMGLLLQLRGKA